MWYLLKSKHTLAKAKSYSASILNSKIWYEATLTQSILCGAHVSVLCVHWIHMHPWTDSCTIHLDDREHMWISLSGLWRFHYEVVCSLHFGFLFFACRQLLKIILKPEHFLPKGRRPWWSQRKPPLVKVSMFKITINKRMTSSIYEHFLFREMCSFMFLLWVWW